MAKEVTKQLPSMARGREVRQWYVIDASGLILGRMCALIASRLRGKNKVNFTPNKNCGDHVVVINAKQVALTGKKESKRFYWHTGYVGGIKFRTIHQLRAEKPEKIIINSVRRMITRSPLGRAVLKNLHVYAGNAHPHMGQQPKILDLASTNRKNVKRK